MDQGGTRYHWKLLRAGELRLDAGSMFGLVPRAVWRRAAPVDDKDRIVLHHNALVLEGGGHRIVVEVGSGGKLDAKSREIFGLGDRTIETALAEVDAPAASIDHVIVTHLHFDHAGGLTRLPRQDEAPGEHGVVPTFARAVVHAQEREWQDALANRSVMTRTYFRDHLDPIRGQLKLHDSARPFPSGYIPDRDELPLLSLEQRTTELVPGVSVFLVPGHTWGQQAVMFTGEGGETVVFTPDVMPTAWHLGAAYSLAYDVEPYTSMVSRHWFLGEAADRGWVLVLDHEPGEARQRVRRGAKGWFELEPYTGRGGL